MGLWQRRSTWTGRVVPRRRRCWPRRIWGFVLLDRTPDWFPFLRFVVMVAGILGAARHPGPPLAAPHAQTGRRASWRAWGWAPPWWRPLFSTVATAATPHSGAIPSVTPDARGRRASAAAASRAAGAASPPAASRASEAGARRAPAPAASRRVHRWRLRRRARFTGGGGAGSPAQAPVRAAGGFPGGGFPGGGSVGLPEVRRRLPQRQQLEPGPDQAPQGGRQPLHLGGRDGELQLGRRIPAGQ